MKFALAINSGSSSIKFQVLDYDTLAKVIGGSASHIGGAGKGRLRVKSENGKDLDEAIKEGTAYEDVFSLILNSITSLLGDNLSKVHLVAHRIVHGGTHTSPVTIRPGQVSEKEAMLVEMDQISSFAPLHNYHSMLIVKSTLRSLPQATSVLTFDTLFHSSLSACKYRYPIPAIPSNSSASSPSVPLRKYGFHGLSYASILSQMAAHLRQDESSLNLVVAHLGSGSSVCCIKAGRSVDTTMELTPMSGLPGGTRSGSVDPSLVFHLMQDASSLVPIDGGHFISKAEYLLNKESGFLAMTSTSDFGEIVSLAFDEENQATTYDKKSVEETSAARERARECYALFLDRLAGYIISYASQLLAEDLPISIVFTGGIGENCARLRSDTMKSMQWIERLSIGTRDGGMVGGIDPTRNEMELTSSVKEITKDGSRIKAFVVVTDEEKQSVILGKRMI